MLAAAAAALVVGCASVISLVVYGPAHLLAERLPLIQAGRRAAVWLASLTFPVAAAVLLGGFGLVRHLTHPLFSPHAERLRLHLCLRALLQGPDAPWQARLFAALCLALVVAALAGLAMGGAKAFWEERRIRKQGRRLAVPEWASRVQVVEAEHAAIASQRGLGRLVVVSPHLARLFPDEQAQAVIAHEVCHALRRDGALGPLACVLLLLQGLSPTAYLAYRQWRKAREEACDLYAARVVSPAALVQALATSEELIAEVQEVSPLAHVSVSELRDLASRLAQAQRLGEGLAEQPVEGTRGVVLTTACLLAALGLALAVPAVKDSVQCAAEALLQALGK